MAPRTSWTRTSGTPSPSGRCTTSATAPRATASGAYSCPSRVKPGTQKNRVPGSTARLSNTRPVTRTPAGPSPRSSRRVIGPGVYERSRSSGQRGDEGGGGADQRGHEPPGHLDELLTGGRQLLAQGTVLVGQLLDGGRKHGHLGRQRLQRRREPLEVLHGLREDGDLHRHGLERGGQVVQPRVGPFFDAPAHLSPLSRHFTRLGIPELCA